MHIGVVSDTQFKHDPRIQNEVSYLTNHNFQVSVLNVSRNKMKVPSGTKNLKIYDLKIPRQWQNIFSRLQNILPVYEQYWAKKINWFIDEIKPDALHVHDLYMAKAAKLGLKSRNIPIVLDLHENYPAAIKSYNWANQFPKNILVRPNDWVKKEKEYLGYGDKLIVLSDHFKEVLCDRYEFIHERNVFVYPNVPDVKKLSEYPIENLSFGKEGDTVLFYFGVIAHRRGLHTVLEALRKIIKTGRKFHLLMIGPIDRADRHLFNEYFSDPVLKDHITYYAWKDIKEFPSFVMSSDIGLSPLIKNDQHESGIANKVYQYMCFGKPVLVSNCRPQENLIEKYQCGWVFESGNVEDLITILNSISQNDNLRKVGEKGQRAVENFENLENRGKALEKLYSTIAKSI